MNEPSTTTIEGFHENDVLCGRGHFTHEHPGNKFFRSLAENMRYEYVAAPKKRKPLFAKMILKAIRTRDPPGRVLKKNEETQLWEEVDERKAMSKASMALREGQPEIRKKLESGEIVVTTHYEAEWNATQGNLANESSNGSQETAYIEKKSAAESARRSHDQKLRAGLLKKIESSKGNKEDFLPGSDGEENVEGDDEDEDEDEFMEIVPETYRTNGPRSSTSFQLGRILREEDRDENLRSSLSMRLSSLGSSMSISSSFFSSAPRQSTLMNLMTESVLSFGSGFRSLLDFNMSDSQPIEEEDPQSSDRVAQMQEKIFGKE